MSWIGGDNHPALCRSAFNVTGATTTEPRISATSLISVHFVQGD